MLDRVDIRTYPAQRAPAIDLAEGRKARDSEIVINGAFLKQQISGVQRYAREIIKAMDRLARDEPGRWGRLRLVAPLGSTNDLELEAITFERIGAGHGHIWEQTVLARVAFNKRLISLGNSGPLLQGRQIVVIHDAAVYRCPDHFSRLYGTAHRTLGRLLRHTASIATVSEFSRRELADVLHMKPNTILVAPNGAEHFIRFAPDATIIDRLGLGTKPYFLTVGNLTPNKNLGIVLDALTTIERSDFNVVVVGRADNKIFGTTPRLDDPRVIRAGRVSDSELRALYQHAVALIFPSRYEGFGIPPLEAMANDCPVIASPIDAVREVCREEASYFDPSDAADLAKVMLAHIDGASQPPPTRSRWQDYTWTQSARIILDKSLQ